MIIIEEVNDSKKWDEFLRKKEIEFYPFFQSWSWKKVQEKVGYKTIPLGVFQIKNEEKVLIGVCLIIEVKAKRGHYFHLRHGPVLLNFGQEVLNTLFSYIKTIAKKNNISFFRMSPLIKNEPQCTNIFINSGFKEAPIHNMDAETCWVLKIEKDEDQLIKEMRKNHRYLIKKAKNMGIKIIRTQKVSDIAIFMKLYENLFSRKHFKPHKDIKEEFDILSSENKSILMFAKYKKKIIAGAIVDFVGNTAIYRHGASLHEYRDVPASYLIQWEAILEAKKRGKKVYNFWGIAPTNNKFHPWNGITLFKTGFGGERLEFIHALDFPLNIKYWKCYLIEYFEKKLKGY